MKKTVLRALKYLIMSVTYGIFYGIISYWTNSVLNMKELIIASVVLFTFLCLLALITPFLRKFLGFEKKEQLK